MKYAIVNKLYSKNQSGIVENEKRSHKIQVIKMDGEFETDRFNIPVIDVRDGEAERGHVNTSLKAASRSSKFMQPSFSVIGKSYQVSHKKNPDELLK